MKEKLSKTALILLMGRVFRDIRRRMRRRAGTGGSGGGQNTAMSSVEDGYHRISAEEAKSVMDKKIPTL